MFSYRHAFHAGNHADVLKHTTLLALLRYLGQKDTALMLVDTHAGAGIYRLDQEQASTSGEAQAGVMRLLASEALADAPPLVADYVQLLTQWNPDGAMRHYPGSPWLAHALLRPQDKLKLFEVHPNDARLLSRNVAALEAGKQIEVLRKNGFEGLKALLPPPSRRALVLMDPSYELKTDYAAVLDSVQDAIKRFPTGTYAIWYPVIARPEAHAMAKKLRTLSTKAGRGWLQAELNVGHAPKTALVKTGHTPLRASGMHIINPPFTLAEQLRQALPFLQACLQEPQDAGWTVVTGEV